MATSLASLLWSALSMFQQWVCSYAKNSALRKPQLWGLSQRILMKMWSGFNLLDILRLRKREPLVFLEPEPRRPICKKLRGRDCTETAQDKGVQRRPLFYYKIRCGTEHFILFKVKCLGSSKHWNKRGETWWECFSLTNTTVHSSTAVETTTTHDCSRLGASTASFFLLLLLSQILGLLRHVRQRPTEQKRV